MPEPSRPEFGAGGLCSARCTGSEIADGGRGLQLVDVLSADWGAYQEDNGKVVWAVISAERDL